jgi:hypothetical protein
MEERESASSASQEEMWAKVEYSSHLLSFNSWFPVSFLERFWLYMRMRVQLVDVI